MPKAQQLPIPGTEPKPIKEIEKASQYYVEKRETFQAASEKVQNAKSALIRVMQEHVQELTLNAEREPVYRWNDELIILSDKVSVKVRPVVDDTDAE